MGHNTQDKEIHSAVDFLVNNAKDAAEARANRLYLEDFTKALKALIMSEHVEMPVNAQEREAMSDQRMLDHLSALKDAIYNDEKNRHLRDAARVKIEVFRTESANYRSIDL